MKPAKPRKPATAPAPPPPPAKPDRHGRADDPRAMRTPQAILKLIEQTVRNVIAETIAPDKARILIYAAQTAAAALKALIIDKSHEELERRIDEIEKSANEWHKKL